MTMLVLLLLALLGAAAARTRPPLPARIVLGYASWNQCDEALLDAVRRGVNVLVWFSIDVANGAVTRGPDAACVRESVARLESEGFGGVVHLISIGGWNAKHFDAATDPHAAYSVWRKWNSEIVAGPGFPSGFHGFDWDLEGNDDPAAPTTSFTIECIHAMGIMSQLAKADGYYVTMAPAQSYMAPWTSEVSLSLQLKDPDWERSIPGLNFAYHGRNSYAYLWALYENAFDLAIVQLYEGYSHTLHSIRFGGLDPADAVAASIRELLTPWKISLGENPDSNTLTVRIKPSQLIVGLANGWADNQKFLFVDKNSLRDAWRQTGGRFRGFGFWTIAEEGTRQHGREPIYLAKELKDIMSERVIDNELR